MSAIAFATLVFVLAGGRANGEGGEIKGNVTWSGCVYLDRDVVVPANATLTIKPGAVILVQSGKDAADKGIYAQLVEIKVHGTLKAEGTAKQPVLFMAVEDAVPAKAKAVWKNDGTVTVGELQINPKRPPVKETNKWGGIHFEKNSKGGVKSCQISNASEGVFAAESAPTVKDCVIFECVSGIQGGNRPGAAGLQGSPVIDGCFIFRCSNGMYFVNAGEPKITNTVVADCSRIGIGYLGLTISKDVPKIDHCVIVKTPLGIEHRTTLGSYTNTLFADCGVGLEVWTFKEKSLEPFKGKLAFDNNAMWQSKDSISAYTTLDKDNPRDSKSPPEWFKNHKVGAIKFRKADLDYPPDGDWRLAEGSPFLKAGTGGTPIGLDKKPTK